MKLRWIITAIISILTLAGAYFSYSQHQSLTDARAKLIAVQETAKVKSAIADSAEKRATVAVRRAERAETRLVISKTVRDSLANCLEAKDGYKTAYYDQKRATVALREVVHDYGDASADILEATDKSFLDRLVPDIRPGVAVGIDPLTRRPGAVVGVTVSWDI